MHWQDIVIGICQFLFVVALLPSLRSHHKPPAATSFMNVALVSTIVFCLATLNLWLSVATGLMVDIAWLILAVQKLKN